MCQFKNECDNFIKSELNTASCVRLCARNPLLSYEIGDFYSGKSSKNSEPYIEYEPVEKIIKDEYQKRIEEIEENKELTSGEKRDLISAVRAEQFTKNTLTKNNDLHEEEMGSDTEQKKGNSLKSLSEEIKKKDEEKKNKIAKVVSEHSTLMTDVTAEFVKEKRPRRKKKWRG